MTKGTQPAAAESQAENEPAAAAEGVSDSAAKTNAADPRPSHGLGGIAAALAELCAIDEEAHVLWAIKGPKNSKIAGMTAVLTQIGAERRVIIVWPRGAWRLWVEAAGTPGIGQIEALQP